MQRSPTLAAAGIAAVTILAACGSGTHSSTQHHSTVAASATASDLVEPQHVAIDEGLPKRRAELALLRVRELYTFWDTGDVRYLHRADSRSFVDRTLPAGRPQGLAGIEQASKTFRAAVPDLHCTVADVLITGDRASVRQVYTGHFTGTFDGVHGSGQSVRFNAFDIQQLGERQIVADWHLEDNLTFMQQIGAVT